MNAELKSKTLCTDTNVHEAPSMVAIKQEPIDDDCLEGTTSTCDGYELLQSNNTQLVDCHSIIKREQVSPPTYTIKQERLDDVMGHREWTSDLYKSNQNIEPAMSNHTLNNYMPDQLLPVIKLKRVDDLIDSRGIMRVCDKSSTDERHCVEKTASKSSILNGKSQKYIYQKDKTDVSIPKIYRQIIPRKNQSRMSRQPKFACSTFPISSLPKECNAQQRRKSEDSSSYGIFHEKQKNPEDRYPFILMYKPYIQGCEIKRKRYTGTKGKPRMSDFTFDFTKQKEKNSMQPRSKDSSTLKTKSFCKNIRSDYYQSELHSFQKHKKQTSSRQIEKCDRDIEPQSLNDINALFLKRNNNAGIPEIQTLSDNRLMNSECENHEINRISTDVISQSRKKSHLSDDFQHHNGVCLSSDYIVGNQRNGEAPAIPQNNISDHVDVNTPQVFVVQSVKQDVKNGERVVIGTLAGHDISGGNRSNINDTHWSYSELPIEAVVKHEVIDSEKSIETSTEACNMHGTTLGEQNLNKCYVTKNNYHNLPFTSIKREPIHSFVESSQVNSDSREFYANNQLGVKDGMLNSTNHGETLPCVRLERIDSLLDGNGVASFHCDSRQTQRLRKTSVGRGNAEAVEDDQNSTLSVFHKNGSERRISLDELRKMYEQAAEAGRIREVQRKIHGKGKRHSDVVFNLLKKRKQNPLQTNLDFSPRHKVKPSNRKMCSSTYYETNHHSFETHKTQTPLYIDKCNRDAESQCLNDIIPNYALFLNHYNSQDILMNLQQNFSRITHVKSRKLATSDSENSYSERTYHPANDFTSGSISEMDSCLSGYLESQNRPNSASFLSPDCLKSEPISQNEECNNSGLPNQQNSMSLIYKDLLEECTPSETKCESVTRMDFESEQVTSQKNSSSVIHQDHSKSKPIFENNRHSDQKSPSQNPQNIMSLIFKDLLAKSPLSETEQELNTRTHSEIVQAASPQNSVSVVHQGCSKIEPICQSELLTEGCENDDEIDACIDSECETNSSIGDDELLLEKESHENDDENDYDSEQLQDIVHSDFKNSNYTPCSKVVRV